MGLEDCFIYFPLLFGALAVNFLGALTVQLPGFQGVSFQRLAVDDSCWLPAILSDLSEFGLTKLKFNMLHLNISPLPQKRERNRFCKKTQTSFSGIVPGELVKKMGG